MWTQADADRGTLNLRVLGSIPRRLTTFPRFHSEICDLRDPRRQPIALEKRPTDPVLSLFCPMHRICAGDASVDARRLIISKVMS